MSRPERKKRSFIWTHFNSVVDGQIAECKHCLKPLSINGGSIGNLSRHMKKLHPLILKGSLGSWVELGGTFNEPYFKELNDLRKTKEHVSPSASSSIVQKIRPSHDAGPINDSRSKPLNLGISESSKAIQKIILQKHIQPAAKIVIVKPPVDRSINTPAQKTTSSTTTTTTTNFSNISQHSKNLANDTALESISRLLKKMNTNMLTGFAELTSRLDTLESSMETCRLNLTELRAEHKQLGAQLSSAEDLNSAEDSNFIVHIQRSFPIDNEKTLTYCNHKLADKKNSDKFVQYMFKKYVKRPHVPHSAHVSISFKDQFFTKSFLLGKKTKALDLFPYILAAFHECLAMTYMSMPPQPSLQAKSSCCNCSLDGCNREYEKHVDYENETNHIGDREFAQEDVSMGDEIKVVVVKNEVDSENSMDNITELRTEQQQIHTQLASASSSAALYSTSHEGESYDEDLELIEHIQHNFPIDNKETLIYYNNKLADKKSRAKFAKYMSKTYVESLHLPPSTNVATYFIDYFFTRRFLFIANQDSPSSGEPKIGLNLFPYILQAFHESIVISHPTLPYLDSLRVIWSCCNDALHGLNTEVNTLPIMEIQHDFMDQSEYEEYNRVCEAAQSGGALVDPFETVVVKCEADLEKLT